MDAVKETESIGINRDFAKTYTADSIGTKALYDSMSKAVGLSKGRRF